MKYYISIVRPINLLIVGVSQWLIYALYVIPLFHNYGIDRVLTGRLVGLFILDTILIAAAGYVINDILDHTTDLINKPNGTFIGADKIHPRHANVYYWTIVLLGGVIAAYIALQIDKPLLFLIYPLATALLYMYSARWKATSLTGNGVVALFCAFVPAIIWYAESDGFQQLYTHNASYILLMGAYILFGFLATMVREIVKDIEDIEGDRRAGARTFPIVAGVDRANVLAVFTFVLLISSYGFWILAMYRLQALGSLGLSIVLLIIPSILTIIQLTKAKEKSAYSAISSYLKLLMVASLVIFISVLLEL